jgi:hypothetical protein
MGRGKPRASLSRRIAVVVVMAIEPAVLVTLLMVIVAATFRVTGDAPHARALAAIFVPLELAISCWLLSVRLERRARAQEYALTEALLGLNGDLAHVFPPHVRRARERVEAKTPLLQLAVQDALEMACETPCAPTRGIAVWVAVVLAGTTVEQWAWQAVLHEGTTGLMKLAAIGPCLALFAVVCNDLRLGRVRGLTDPRRLRRWSEGYRPEPTPTILPSTPVLLLFLVPAMSLGVNWTAGGSLGAHLSVMEAVFGLWLLAWNGRGAVTSPAFRRVERLAAPLDELIRRSVVPTWDVLSYICRWCCWGSAALLTLALSWPASMRSGAASTLNGVSAVMLVIGLILGPLVLNHWRRPVAPCTRSAQHLLREQGETQIRRISTWLNVSLGASMLLIIILGGLV